MRRRIRHRGDPIALGTRKVVTIDDIVAAEGDRIPAMADAPTQFKMGFVFLVRPGEEVEGIELTGLNAIRDAFATRLLILTGGKGIVEVFPEAPPEPPVVPPSPPPILPPHSGPRTRPVDLFQELNWLVARQAGDGGWGDL